MSRSTREGAEVIYRVAERFKEAALLSTGSLLTPGQPIWAAAALEELNQRFVLQPDSSGLSFEQKLAGQLAGATDAAVQLMAEILLMHLLINRRISGKRKRELLRAVLSRGGTTGAIDIPPDVDEALDYGICWPGTFFNTGRDRQLRFLIEWMRGWRRLAGDECARLLADPWAFKEHLFQVELASASLQRNAVLHLLFPDYFERIMAPEHKASVVAAFADRIGGRVRAQSLDEDRALLEIREALAEEFGADFDFYDTPEIASVWRGTLAPVPSPQIPLLDRVLAYYPDWVGFSDPRYVKDEREYKDKASELAISLLGREPLRTLIDEGRFDELVGRIEQVVTNLLWTNVPRDGDLALLYRQELHLPTFAKALFDLLHGEGESSERLDRFFDYTSGENLPTKWTLPTYLLMLLSPETDVFIKPDMTRWFLKQVSPEVVLPPKPSGEAYRQVLDVVIKLRDALVSYEPSDLIDIQGYIWIANHAPVPKPLGKPFDEIFPDWDTAWWAFDVLRDGLSRLGVDAANDNRVAVSLAVGGRSIHVSFASWLLFGFGREKSVPQAGIVPLRVDSSLLPDAPASGTFAADPTINLRYLPLADLRGSWEAIQPEVNEVLNRAKALFSTHVATPFRRHNRPDVEAAIFDETAREKLLKEGLVSLPAPVDSIYRHLVDSKYHFPDWLVTDYVLSLATKPFVILSGISGTGKTKMAQLVSAFVAPDTDVDVVVAPPPDSLGDGFTRVEVRQSAITYRLLTIPADLVGGLMVSEPSAASDLTVEADGQTFPARLYVHPSAHNYQLYMKPELRAWFAQRVQVGDYIGMKVNPLEEGFPAFELEIRTLSIERRVEKRTSARVAFVAVRPDWTDNRGLLGYYNPLTREYAPTELLRLLLRAHAHPDEPHFVILDEMNLAKVEYYFSDFLSAMESGTEMVLHDASEDLYVDSDDGQMLVPRRLTVPGNVFFTGTVNVDETTYMFSPKVLDRANIIEFNELHLESYGSDAPWESGEFRLRDGVEVEELLRTQTERGKPAPEDWTALPAGYKERLRGLHAVMAAHNLHFGYRVANEVARYLLLGAEHVGEEALEDAFDLQILQKVLPKLAGNRARLYQPMRELLQWCVDPDAVTGAAATLAGSVAAVEVIENARYPRSAIKLKRMLETLETVGFVSFVE